MSELAIYFAASLRGGANFADLERRVEVRSTRLHFHVDAPDVGVLRAIARQIYARNKGAQGQIKLYPIASLYLGAQQARLPIYPPTSLHPSTLGSGCLPEGFNDIRRPRRNPRER